MLYVQNHTHGGALAHWRSGVQESPALFTPDDILAFVLVRRVGKTVTFPPSRSGAWSATESCRSGRWLVPSYALHAGGKNFAFISAIPPVALREPLIKLGIRRRGLNINVIFLPAHKDTCQQGQL